MFRCRDTLTVAMAEPQSVALTIDRLQQLTGLRVRPVLVLEQNLQRVCS